MQENNYFIISSELPKKMNVYLEQEYTEDIALSKKRVSKSKNIGQKTEWPEKEITNVNVKVKRLEKKKLQKVKIWIYMPVQW